MREQDFEVSRRLSLTNKPLTFNPELTLKLQELIEGNKNLSSQVQYLVKSQSTKRNTSEFPVQEDIAMETADERFFQKATFKNPTSAPQEQPKQAPVYLNAGPMPTNMMCTGQTSCLMHSGYFFPNTGFLFNNGLQGTCLNNLQQFMKPGHCCENDVCLKSSAFVQQGIQKENRSVRVTQNQNDDFNAQNQNSGNFLTDKQGTLFENAHMRVRIRQARPFKDQTEPHLKFYLTFRNTSMSNISGLSCGFKGQSSHCNLMVNTKKLASSIPATSEASLAFVIFPLQYPFEEPKLNVRYNIDDGGRLQTISETIKIDIPFNKFIRFVPIGQSLPFDDLPSKAGTLTRKVHLPGKHLAPLRDLPAFFPNVMDSTRQTQTPSHQIYKGIFYFILNTDQREYSFQANFDVASRMLQLSLNSEPVSVLAAQDDGYLLPLIQQFEAFLLDRYQSSA
jgi:hypothetical protein